MTGPWCRVRNYLLEAGLLAMTPLALAAVGECLIRRRGVDGGGVPQWVHWVTGRSGDRRRRRIGPGA